MELQRVITENARERSAEMRMLLLGSRDDDCPLRLLNGHSDILRQIAICLCRPAMPSALSAELAAGRSLFKCAEPHWLVKLHAGTDWSACWGWKLEKKRDDSGVGVWVRREPRTPGVDGLANLMDGCGLGESVDGCVPSRMAVEGASVTFALHGVEMAGVISRRVSGDDGKLRVRVQHATGATWLELRQLFTAAAAVPQPDASDYERSDAIA